MTTLRLEVQPGELGARRIPVAVALLALDLALIALACWRCVG